MYVTISGSKNNPIIYIIRSIRKPNGKTSSRVYRKLGYYNELIKNFDNDKDKLMEWANNEALSDTQKFNSNNKKISLKLSRSKFIKKDEERCFNISYLFLQQLCTELRLDKICRNIKSRHKFNYDFHAILTDLIYARILSPSSKRSSYDFAKTLFEPPKYSLQNVYRSLSVMAKESSFIQTELYKNSNFVKPRNKKILYYDCTNYYFEIEDEDGLKKYGKSKEHRPNPIVTMGLFMDEDGIPLAFDIFPGNQNEQTTLDPLEKKVINDFECSEFIFCSDAGLGSKKNRFLNSFGNRAYVITQSIKKLKKEDKDYALSPSQFKKIGSNKFIDINDLDETNEDVYNSIYYKEIPIITGNMDETVIVTYSPKYKAYQEKIRERQLERAARLISSSSVSRKSKNPNDPARFIKKTAITNDGEVAENNIYEIDEDKIKGESKFDGFYAVITNLEGDVGKIININKQRWEIEENFRIMKTEFEARPVYVRRDDRIKAHFLICYISLLVYRLLEKKLNEEFTCENILNELRKMNLTLLTEDSGYVPSYKRTDLTDALHKAFGFHTDYEYMSKSTIRTIIKNTKIIKKKK